MKTRKHQTTKITISGKFKLLFYLLDSSNSLIANHSLTLYNSNKHSGGELIMNMEFLCDSPDTGEGKI